MKKVYPDHAPFDVKVKILRFFDGDHEKTKLWFETPNMSLFGGLRPIDVQNDRLRKTVRIALAENIPDRGK